MNSKRQIALMWRWSLVSAAVIGLFWLIWFLNTGNVPEVTEIQMTPEWKIFPRFNIPRWWDVLIGPIWSIWLVQLFTSEKSSFHPKLVSWLVDQLGYGMICQMSHPNHGLIGVLASGLGCGMVAGLLAGIFGMIIGLDTGLLFGLCFLLIVGLVTGCLSGIETWLVSEMLAGLVVGLAIGLGYTIVGMLGYVLTVGLDYILVVGLLTILLAMLLTGLYHGRERELRTGIVYGLLHVIVVVLGYGTGFGLVVGLIAGLVVGLVHGMIIGLVGVLGFGLVGGLAYALLAGLVYGPIGLKKLKPMLSWLSHRLTADDKENEE